MKRIQLERLGQVTAARYAAKIKPTCVLCDRVALYRVGTKGYCRMHYAEAVKHRRRVMLNGEYNARRHRTEEVTE